MPAGRCVVRTSNGAARAKARRLPIDDPNFALFTGRRGFRVVAGGMLYRSDGVVGLSNVVAEAADAVAVWRSLILLSAQTFPRLPLVGYELGGELAAALDAGFEIGDPLRIWVQVAALSGGEHQAADQSDVRLEGVGERNPLFSFLVPEVHQQDAGNDR